MSANNMTKNWSAIAGCGNEQLRLTLIAADGETATGLAAGFPQYFLAAGEEPQQISVDALIALVGECANRDQALQVLKDQGLPHQRFCFSGSCSGRTDGVSYAKGGYPTVRHGWAQNFWRSNVPVGEPIEYEGAVWLVAYNGFSRGSAETVARHTLILVPLDALS